MRHWLAVEFHLPKGVGEAISNFLFEQGATGIEELEGDLKMERWRTYFPPTGEQQKVLQALRLYLRSLQKISQFPFRPSIRTLSIFEQDWGENWKRFFRPVQVTPRICVKPPWTTVPSKRGLLLIDITPSMAFGTGTHATTHLCIQALEKGLKKKTGSVLDVGTGSGILSIIAAKLGAKEVLGIDIDGLAIENARENVMKNHVSDIVKIKRERIGQVQKKFDFMVANLDFKSLKKMRRPLLKRLEKRGILILSGILEREKEEISQSYLATGWLKGVTVAQKEEWVCLTFKKIRG